MTAAENPQIAMINQDIWTLPDVRLPLDYSCRSFLQGDEHQWDKIIDDSFGGTHHFEQEMMQDKIFAPERVWFICYRGQPVATASAWYHAGYGDYTGNLHMVGIHHLHAGQGLGMQACLAALHQMKKEGRRFAVLTTDDFRIPAIKTYFKLGFVPMLTHESHQNRWASILASIQRVAIFENPISILLSAK